MDNDAYFKKWRKQNPNRWALTQLRWYYKNRTRIIQGQSKARGIEPDEYDKWSWRRDNL